MKAGVLVVGGIFLVCLTGCATTSRKSQMESENLKDRVSSLEMQLQQKNAEVGSLRMALAKKTEEAAVTKQSKEPQGFAKEDAGKPAIKQIQKALKNAGFNPGPVDGRSGTQTRLAIKEFQKVNNLNPDGKVGKQTWALLEPYLNKEAAVEPIQQK
jgi:peptidoglycan hydrolase-like protein with peptidoglycan-binding domain